MRYLWLGLVLLPLALAGLAMYWASRQPPPHENSRYDRR